MLFITQIHLFPENYRFYDLHLYLSAYIGKYLDAFALYHLFLLFSCYSLFSIGNVTSQFPVVAGLQETK